MPHKVDIPPKSQRMSPTPRYRTGYRGLATAILASAIKAASNRRRSVDSRYWEAHYYGTSWGAVIVQLALGIPASTQVQRLERIIQVDLEARLRPQGG